MVFSLSNTLDIVANTISVIEDNKVIDVKELFLSKLGAIENIVGLPPDTLNTLQKLGEAINNDSNFYENLIKDLSFKANTADTYRKAEPYTDDEVNDLITQLVSNLTASIALKANTKDTHTKTEVDTYLTDKADKANTYTKADNYNKIEINTYLLGKADKSDSYTKNDVNVKLTNLIGSAPEVLNTLTELAAALGNDSNYATAIQNQLNGKEAVGTSYLKSEVDTMMALRASQTDVYSKAEVNATTVSIGDALNNKAENNKGNRIASVKSKLCRRICKSGCQCHHRSNRGCS
jgi:hypothetical protein